jgi:hypothetical protein
MTFGPDGLILRRSRDLPRDIEDLRPLEDTSASAQDALGTVWGNRMR